MIDKIYPVAEEFFGILKDKEGIAEEYSDEIMSLVTGGRGTKGGDARKGISAEYAPEEYAAGDLSDIDGWDE